MAKDACDQIKPDDQHLIPRNHISEGEKQLLQLVLWPPNRLPGKCAPLPPPLQTDTQGKELRSLDSSEDAGNLTELKSKGERGAVVFLTI